VSVFGGFGPPRQRLELRVSGLGCEIWPELGGAVAAFETLDERGGARALFRPTPAAARYLPLQLSSWPLLPYANRIRDGRFAYAGRAHVLPRNLPGFSHPLHGLGVLRAWQVTEASSRECTLSCRCEASRAWPYGFRARQQFLLDEAGLCVTMELQNTDELPMPYGLGQHPYIVRPPGTRIQALVRGVWLTDAETLPIACAPVPREWDLSEGCHLDEVAIDNCFVGFAGAARVLWPDGSALRISASADVEFLVIYSPPGQDFVCVEPVTQVPDCFNLAAAGCEDVGLRVLAPGQSAVVVHRFDFERDSEGQRSRRPLS
jgi:aldose 1-epimerase